MNVLAVDTALTACSVAILAGDRATVVSEPMPRGHAEALMPMLESAFAQAGLGYGDIDRFVVTIGPGTFTGVRVGVSAVRGFALTTGKPAVGISTLQALAATARDGDGVAGPLLVAMDARRDEVYAQAFDAAGGALTEPMVITVADLLERVPEAVSGVYGSAAEAVADAARDTGRNLAVMGTRSAPDPVSLAALGRATEPTVAPAPLYLRPPDAKPQAGAALPRR